ncbi:alpha/beta fold hydrolase [Aeromicrobium sp.]|uniref:alpha/beta fold hydrolase n=1 Tax=Aeromicrobium sp. TaxID=1871063 RepID=UPI002FC696AC
MPYATNRLDGVRTYVEDWAADGPPILVYTGLGDPLEDAQENPLVQALAPNHHLYFADHRGHGRSDKPHDDAAYALPTRVADVVAVLDHFGLDSVHLLGFSWGARLGFAFGEHEPDRVRSLTLCGNQPYAWDPSWPPVPLLTRALDLAQGGGMKAFADFLERAFGEKLPPQARERVLANDPQALAAAWRSALAEGPVSANLSAWDLPCLIYMAVGEDMFANAERAASEIPAARFLALDGLTHLSAPYEVDQVLPAVLALVADAEG